MNETHEDVAQGLSLRMSDLLDRVCAYRLLEYHSERNSQYVISEILDQCFGKGFTEDRTQFFRFKGHLERTDFKVMLSDFERKGFISFDVDREKLTVVVTVKVPALMSFVK